jgi:hypothetical protein
MFGFSPEHFAEMETRMLEQVHPSRKVSELVQVWEDQGAVMVRVLNSWGDPVELGETEARHFAEQLRLAIQEVL